MSKPKKTQVGLGSKINHLSYVGDATLGADVNIGAGVITCNYDGVNKFNTIIGDNAFVGSNSSLVAPVTVGKGATIGAGSVITKDTPDDKLSLARARQTTIDGWRRPAKNKLQKKLPLILNGSFFITLLVLTQFGTDLTQQQNLF